MGYYPTYIPQNYGPQGYMHSYTPLQTPQNVLQQGGGNGFLCRPVTSKEEAEVYQIPFDGSKAYFVDTSNGNLYSRTFDFNTGKAPVVTYMREAPPPAVQYATVDQLNAVLEEIERLKKPAQKKVVKNDEPNE